MTSAVSSFFWVFGQNILLLNVLDHLIWESNAARNAIAIISSRSCKRKYYLRSL